MFRKTSFLEKVTPPRAEVYSCLSGRREEWIKFPFNGLRRSQDDIPADLAAGVGGRVRVEVERPASERRYLGCSQGRGGCWDTPHTAARVAQGNNDRVARCRVMHMGCSDRCRRSDCDCQGTAWDPRAGVYGQAPCAGSCCGYRRAFLSTVQVARTVLQRSC